MELLSLINACLVSVKDTIWCEVLDALNLLDISCELGISFEPPFRQLSAELHVLVTFLAKKWTRFHHTGFQFGLNKYLISAIPLNNTAK